MADTYKAELDGYSLDIETIEDSFEKSIAEYEFPYKDGALLEDMGQKARTIKIRCYFYGEDYLTHLEFLNHLEKKEAFELLHPKYGLLNGSVKSVSVKHDDRTETAEIDISFVENLRGDKDPNLRYRQGDINSTTEDLFEQGQIEQMDEFSQDTIDELGAAGMEILNKTLDFSLGVLEQFQDVSGAVRNYIKSVDTYVSGLESILNDIANPANSIISTIDYGVNLPGRVISAVAKTVERYAILYDSLRTAPTRFINSLSDGCKSLENAFSSFSKHTKIASVQRCALESSYFYKADELKRLILRKSEKAKSFDALGNYIKSETIEPIMAVNELEQTLADVREYLQDAIDSARQMQSLKDLAEGLLAYVNSIKIERDKIIKVSIDNPLPLHLVCLKYGLSYNYAERIHSINKIRNPNFMSGDISIYAR